MPYKRPFCGSIGIWKRAATFRTCTDGCFKWRGNYLRDERKSARRQRTVPLDGAMEREARFADPGGSPEHCALGEERTRRLRAAIEKLPPQQRECMLLRSSGLRYREIAEILGINTSSVGPLVQRAVARLSEDLS